jgi:hypothetical protein
MSNPQDDSTEKAPIDPALQAVMPTGMEVHDALMAPIEQDLLTKNLPLLATKYSDESPADRTARIDRYKTALRAYDKAYAEWVSGVSEKVEGYKKTVISYAQEHSAAKDEGEISRLESEFSDSQND